jgi:transporter family-2 protein
MLLAVAVVGGAAIAIQAQLMGVMDRRLGTLESVFVTYAGGALLVLLAVVWARGGHLGEWHRVPWYTLTAGVFGLVIVGSIGYSVSRLGIVPAFTVLVASQFIIGALIDHFGLLGAPVRPLDLSRLAGIPVLIAGIWLVLR